MNPDNFNSDNDCIKFLDFINRLTNPEKSRNFNRFHAYSLDPFQGCMEKFQKPHTSKLKISIVGTNGKGSLAHYLSELLQKYGKVGLYTSPHLITPLERIRINSKNAVESELDDILIELCEENGNLEYLQNFSYFEIFTLFSKLYFNRQSCDFEIYEAGLGGRLDATKLMNAEIVVLTKIDLDHTEILGKDEVTILKEKLGIIRENTKILFCLDPNSTELKNEILQFTEKLSIPVYFYSYMHSEQKPEFNYLHLYFEMAIFILDILYKVKIIEFKIDKPATDFRQITPPQARLEKLNDNPLIIYDTGHNPRACMNALNDLKNNYSNIEWDCIVGCLPDKDSDSIYQNISSLQNVSNLLFLDYSPFKKPTKHQANSLDSEQKLIDCLKENINNKVNTLVMGSFRIYPIVQNVLMKTMPSM
ncbi:hypothetical protein [Leptospira sp. GIMC2001]|uniref:hypothetical protein n=1 Tax=Leptospira sp. GIMC2001 TaxID=1513297 RepID=UPI00234A139B|nr:hypothetical protein [Leptospira sp. GIMC2001]WCL50382.1 hypothetical protein O4O04_06070 [Leptospira sp. GIMC2001]